MAGEERLEPWFLRLCKWRRVVQAIALAGLVEQTYEVLVLRVSLAEHPLVVLACLGALGLGSAMRPEGARLARRLAELAEQENRRR